VGEGEDLSPGVCVGGVIACTCVGTGPFLLPLDRMRTAPVLRGASRPVHNA
jgi:hypothetical protein